MGMSIYGLWRRRQVSAFSSTNDAGSCRPRAHERQTWNRFYMASNLSIAAACEKSANT